MLSLWKRELQSYFYTPVGYVFMAIFLLVGGVFFVLYNMLAASAELITLFGNLVYLFMMIMPLMTMRLLSEEKRERTEILLLTSPVSLWDIVLGKFLAACTLLALSLLGTFPMIAILIRYSRVYPGLLVCHYLGFFLLGCAFISIGVLISALTETQLSAAVLTFGVNLLLLFQESAGNFITIPGLSWLHRVFSWLSLQSRYNVFASGILSFADILYYVTFCLVFVFLTVRVLDRRRWSEA